MVTRKGSQHGNSEGIIRMERTAVRSNGLAPLRDYVKENFSRKTNGICFLYIGWEDILEVRKAC